MSRRDKVREILDRSERAAHPEGVSGSFAVASDRLWYLMHAYEDTEYDLVTSKKSHESLKYVPVACVAIIQSYYRQIITEGLNSERDDKFRKNAHKLKGSVSFDIDSVLAIGVRTVSAGDFIAHHISMNSVDSIMTTMTKLVGYDFLAQLILVGESRSEPINIDLKILHDLFEKRHIICHEYGFSTTISAVQAFDYVRASDALLLGTENVFIDELVS